MPNRSKSPTMENISAAVRRLIGSGVVGQPGIGWCLRSDAEGAVVPKGLPSFLRDEAWNGRSNVLSSPTESKSPWILLLLLYPPERSS